MRDSAPTIDILCKVIDNYGDIGVAYRLARALSDLDPGLRLRLVVDGLGAFAAICPGIDPDLLVQRERAHGWTVIDWRGPGPGWKGFADAPPRLVVECFACNRPGWFEDALFDECRPGERFVVNLEYLTGEPYARDFHRMASATRSPLVRKSFFMPGLEAGTGGLILDRPFMAAREAFLDPVRRTEARIALARKAGFPRASASGDAAGDASAAAAAPPPRAPVAAAMAGAEAQATWVSVFSYEHDFGRIVADLALWNESRRAAGHPLLALVAPGRSAGPFLAAWEEAGRPFAAITLPFLPQEMWDEVILASDVSIVRGEDSLSRAALSGRPFLWQAYLQAERHQLVKVGALLDRMRPFFRPGSDPGQDAALERRGQTPLAACGIVPGGQTPPPSLAFAALEALFLALNDREADGPGAGGDEPLLAFLEALPALEPGFRAFSESLVAIGDLASALLTFLYDFV